MAKESKEVTDAEKAEEKRAAFHKQMAEAAWAKEEKRREDLRKAQELDAKKYAGKGVYST